MKSGIIETSDGTKLVNMLNSIQEAIKVHGIGQRKALLKDKKND